MKLYYAPGACSLAVHIALREIGATFDGVAVDVAKHTTANGENYRDISPRGYVPLLQLDDGSRHTEVAALLQVVADLDPAQSLIGAAGSGWRLTVIEWLSFVSTELHKVFSPWLWHKETADSTRQTVKDMLATRFAELDALLSTQEYLAGEFSVADAYAFTIVNWTRFMAIPLVLVSHALCPYVQRAAIVLAEKGVPFERRDIDLANKPDWFLKASPLGETPVLLGAFYNASDEAALAPRVVDTAVGQHGRAPGLPGAAARIPVGPPIGALAAHVAGRRNGMTGSLTRARTGHLRRAAT